MLRRLCFLALLLLLTHSATRTLAQDTLVMQPISYGQEVSGVLSEDQFFAHWELGANAGDHILIRMTGADGLRPLIGIISKGGTLLERSEDGEVNGSIELDFTVPDNDSYRIVATRVDNQFGTTTGSYTLSVDLLNPPPTRDPNFQEVTFLCGDTEATALASILFTREAGDNGAYSLRVYGLEGLQPVIRVQSGERNECITRLADAVGDVIVLPGERPITLTDVSATVQDVITSETGEAQTIMITIGSATDLPGRYAAVIGGFSIEPTSDRDDYGVRLAPRPAQSDSSLLVYALGVNNRLDPGIVSDLGQCDDAGRRGCEDVPSFDGAGVIFNGAIRVIGDRFDAGMRITDAAQHYLQVLSFSSTTHGDYALILLGASAPRDSP